MHSLSFASRQLEFVPNSFPLLLKMSQVGLQFMQLLQNIFSNLPFFQYLFSSNFEFVCTDKKI